MGTIMNNPLPAGRYGAILADPPWSFRTYGKQDVAPARGEQPYAVMSLDDIKALPVAAPVAVNDNSPQLSLFGDAA